MTPRILVIGDIVTDVMVEQVAPPAPNSDTQARIRSGVGGAGANVSAWLRAAGSRVRLIGRVGADPMGIAHLRRLGSLGVELRIAVDETEPTGTVVVLVDEQGQRTMFPDRGANAALAVEQVRAESFRDVDHLHLSAYPLLDPRSRAAALAALDGATATGRTVSIDPSSAAPLRAAGVDDFLAWTRGATLCIPNADEAAAMLKANPGTVETVTLAERLSSYYGEVVVTGGADPAVWTDGTAVVAQPAEHAPVRDSTGAGDAFTAAFLAARLQGASAGDALAAGHRAGARAVATLGAHPPT